MFILHNLQRIITKKSISENDHHSDILEEDISDKDIDFTIRFPKKITLKTRMRQLLEGSRG